MYRQLIQYKLLSHILWNLLETKLIFPHRYEKNERTICFNNVNFPNMRSILKGLVANKENKGLVYITNFDS